MMETKALDQQKINLLLVDDHQLFIDGLRSILGNHPRFSVWRTARDGREALQLLQYHKPDVVVMDLNMPRIDGQQAAAKALSMYPQLKILVVSMYYTASLQASLRNMGIGGFIPKDSDATVLIRAIEAIYEGGRYFVEQPDNAATDDENNQKSVRQKYNLTKREAEIIRLVRQNKTTQEIAEQLFVSPFTIETHRRNICAKLDIKGNNGLFLFAQQHVDI
ncbi:two component transcriptional regulator, LuxR family [Parapedobacter luteus]|uniref:Two component transcriptional regulator, LuxR family n=1 Tax=Parapedobacter luteus TaxID=623280 RepID=A0A1T5E543_9SPHI|nr:response regulator transcription factor [Parapedobacter luteus]SKB78994.1 two component transcriptional regulator, LuxR family [Parapedobacter luteus]